MSYKQIETKDQDGNILVTPFADVSNDPNYKIVENFDSDGKKLATPVAVVIGGGGGGGDISGLVRNLTSLGANVSITEIINSDGTKNYELTVDGITQNELTTQLDNYYTKNDVDTKLAAKQNSLTAGTNITIENDIISANLTATSRVKTLAELGITEAVVNALVLKPSSTDDTNRRNSFKEFVFLVADKLGENDVLIEQVYQSTRPKAYNYLYQIVHLEKFKASSASTDPIEIKVTKTSFELNGLAYSFARKITGVILKAQNVIRFLEFQNMRPGDLIWDDSALLNQATRIRNYITAILWYNSNNVINISIGTTVSNNIYKDCIALFNKPSTYSSGFVLTIYSTAQNYSMINQPQTFELAASFATDLNQKLLFNHSQTGVSYIPISIANMGSVRYSKTIQATTVADGETFQLTNLMSPSGRDQCYVLGTKDIDGSLVFNNPTLQNGLLYVNHNRRVNITCQVRMDISLGSTQTLNIFIRRGNGVIVETNIGSVQRTNDTTKTTTNILTFSTGLTDLFVTSGFELILVNNSDTSISIPAQTITIDFYTMSY